MKDNREMHLGYSEKTGYRYAGYGDGKLFSLYEEEDIPSETTALLYLELKKAGA